MQHNCGQCGSCLHAGEPLGQCLECGQFLCESCHDDYCKACNSRFAANLAAELKALDPAPKPKEPVWEHESGLSRRRHQWEDLGYGT